MKFSGYLLLFIVPLLAAGQNDTIIYFGSNGKMNPTGSPVLKKEIRYTGKNLIRVITENFSADGTSAVLFTERITRKTPGRYIIRVKGQDLSETIERRFEPQKDGTFAFTDLHRDELKRSGTAISQIPLILHGEVTEYYPGGNKKSVSVYENNELISNRNWNTNGEEYISNVFYSVDQEPGYLKGTEALHVHVLKTFRDSEIDLSQLAGRMVVGFVVMEDGTIDGIRIEQGMGLELNNVALTAFYTLPGNWRPATLGGKNVRFYQLFPINFIYREYDFKNLELRGSMLYWEIN